MKRRGFTFIELIIVCTIIAMLAMIAVPNFLEAQIRSAVARSLTELTLIKSGIEAYRLENRMYPLHATPGVPDPWDLKILTTPVAYLPRLPDDFFTTRQMRGRNRSRPMERVPYGYFNAYQINGDAGLKHVGEGPAPYSGYAAGIIWGLGPASSLRREAGDSPTRFTSEGEAVLVAYDPTNGTTSGGDLYVAFP